MDFLLAGTLDLLRMEWQCRVIVQRSLPLWPGSPVENIPLQAERYSGGGQKLFALPERCSASDRNRVHLRPDSAHSADFIGLVERGINAPSVDRLQGIADDLSVEVWELLK